jgi:hypothetical protein
MQQYHAQEFEGVSERIGLETTTYCSPNLTYDFNY